MSDSLLTAKCQSKLSLDVGCWNLDFGWRDAGILGFWDAEVDWSGGPNVWPCQLD